MTHPSHEHDLGFAQDLPRMVGRRRLIALMGGLGLASATGVPASALECVSLPWETAGPYPADGSNAKRGQTVNALIEDGVIRHDLRPSFGNLTPVADGVPLELELTLQDAAGCSPLSGHAIYVWHCDVAGKYSLYDTTDANYLRGVGLADADGKVRFTTIVPGCYDGRWPHIHFEVFQSVEAAVSGEASVLTAQIALPGETAATVYAGDSRYPDGARNLGRITLASDNVFADNSAEQLQQQTLAMTGDIATGYRGTVTIPVDFKAERSASRPPRSGGWFFGRKPPRPPSDN
ncbi:hypothetical protein [Puniceibacterium sediminis]|uniref:Protocatechuate 3,4-dioxygenase beta subunit n=1 Tax=Puniceibacterium sediminis TaxID=1608407 RepID=A0A238YE88_9RHOB|nr:hypothetical protein [Puniceibacterium sediminis]SNR69272.1 Protocatechuate 3,4-dioxygenase beta subunit [Puniceibacterium sediminis]